MDLLHHIKALLVQPILDWYSCYAYIQEPILNVMAKYNSLDYILILRKFKWAINHWKWKIFTVTDCLKTVCIQLKISIISQQQDINLNLLLTNEYSNFIYKYTNLFSVRGPGNPLTGVYIKQELELIFTKNYFIIINILFYILS